MAAGRRSNLWALAPAPEPNGVAAAPGLARHLAEGLALGLKAGRAQRAAFTAQDGRGNEADRRRGQECGKEDLLHPPRIAPLGFRPDGRRLALVFLPVRCHWHIKRAPRGRGQRTKSRATDSHTRRTSRGLTTPA